MSKLKDYLATEKGKMRGMTFGEKLGYFWEYYKFHLLFTAIVVTLVVMLLIPSEREYLYIAWLVPYTQHTVLEETSEKLHPIVENPNREVVAITNYSRSEVFGPNQAMQQRFTAMMRIGAIDLFATPRHGVLELAGQGLLMPMHRVMGELYHLNPEVYRQATAYLLTISYTFEGENETTDIYAIRVSLTPFFRALDQQDLYLAVPFNASKFYEAARALEAIFTWEP